MNQLRAGMKPPQILEHFKKVALTEKAKRSTPSLEDVLEKEGDQGKRIAVIIPQGETDVLLINSLLKNLKHQYKDYNIYVFTQPSFYPYIDDNPYVYKLMPYSPSVENSFAMEGAGENKGYFEMAFYPHTTTQKNASYLHNGLDKPQFSLR